ncbi:MAG: C25 family cysteine peptidase [Chitinophagaceae bacterium]|nr:C25 family cysteine peptidase [Chitinophagaceae bacterium]
MIKRVLFIICVFGFFASQAQYNNEWIDYNKTYYKFPVGKTGLYRISRPVLEAAGLGDTPAENFQLWRNGIQVPLYTSVSAGPLDAGGYLEFWGEMNDGKPDTKLYRNINDQLSDQWSLETDTASFFLTVNPSGNNPRLQNEANNTVGNTLDAEPYFMYTYGKYYKNRINPGYASLVVEYIYSSVYDKGEGYTSGDIRPASPLSETVNNLFVYTAGPDATFFIAAAGNALYNRNLSVSVNNVQVVDAVMNVYNDQRQQVTLPSGLLNTGSAAVKITNTSDNPNDRMVVSRYEITYPRQFNFGNSTNFSFELPETSVGNFLRITNFNRGSVAPVLYDLSNRKRYTGDISESGVIKFVLPPSVQKRKLVLVNMSAGNINQVTAFTSRNFVNYAQPDRQGDYLIVSNALLYNGSNGNPVEAYAQYRSSAPGGSYTAKIYDIDQLTDQFAFGIKRHPGAVKNFVKYAEDVFSTYPRAIFIIGKGVNYIDARTNQANPLLDRLNLVPSFGHPASDNLLVSRDNETISSIPVGRLSVVLPSEVEVYLKKVKEYEAVAVDAPQTVAGRAWMKNILHAIGGGNPTLTAEIGGYMNHLKTVIEDTLLGGNVKNFTNSSVVKSDLSSEDLKRLFSEGIGILNYFGHSSASTLEFNIDDPNMYENQGKYPFFLVNGCLAGDIFMFDQTRINMVSSLSEKYILADQRGSIGFIASSHFGIVNYLNSYLNGLYKTISQSGYGLSIGKIIEESFRYLLGIWGNDFFARAHAEEITLHGDPVVHPYAPSRPDYAVEESLVELPPLISIADKNISVSAKIYNLGKAVDDSITLEVKRQMPDGSITTVIRKRVAGINFDYTVDLTLPVNPMVDKGENKLIFSIDADNEVDEISEMNNTTIKTFYIIDDGAKPVYPYNYSIVSGNHLVLQSSTSDPLAPQKNYVIEIDSSRLFNSPFKRSVTKSSKGGIISAEPGITLLDSVVYYWRIAVQGNAPEDQVWNTSSFVYLPGALPGYNQSHYFQFKDDQYNEILLDDDRVFRFHETPHALKITTGLYPYFVGDRLFVSLDETQYDQYGCTYNSIQIKVYDSVTMIPWTNSLQPDGLGEYGSLAPCGHNKYTFEFSYRDSASRRRAIEFIEGIPAGHYISITNLGMTSNTSFIDSWKKDTAQLGTGRSLYHVLKNQGFTDIDLFTRNLPFLYFYKKGDAGYPATSVMGPDENSYISQVFSVHSRMTSGEIESPWFGPSLEWHELYWDGKNVEADADKTSIQLYGKKTGDEQTLLATIDPARDTSLSFIDAKEYPYLKMKLTSEDSLHGTPHQLKYWRLTGKLPPEGAIAPQVYYLNVKDTVELGETMQFGIGFKNISEEKFDSLKVRLVLLDNNNVKHLLDTIRLKPLSIDDTVKVSFSLDTRDYPGMNTFSIEFNPDFDQPEQYFLNNFLYKTFFVRPDNINPLLDVTFDGVHILNNDIVSSRPHILIKLKDENHFLALDDTTLLKVQVRFPDGQVRPFSFTGDTLRFTPAILNDGNASGNIATVDFNPSFLEDGDYELIVSGRDKSGNNSGQTAYRVGFKIINKPMISNMFNYPNPFTTSTAFVFTLTGSDVPQNIRIQILTITGKIVREITKEELGPIRIGRNITEYKWDGRDQYGQKLANGVYLYRVITNLNGKSLDKYKTEGDRTDQYFDGGYGKMYLMR